MAKGSDTGRRLAVAAVAIPVGVAAIYAGRWVLGVLLALVVAIGVHEFAALSKKRGVRPFTVLGMAGAVLLIGLAAWTPQPEELAPRAMALLVALTLVLLATAVFRRGAEGRPLAAVSSTLTAVLYVAGTLVFALLIRHSGDSRAFAGAVNPTPWEGTALLLLPLLVTWVGDSMAYFGGRRWGKSKLAPTVSPNKTVFGGVAGLAGSTVVGGLWGGLVLSQLAEAAVPAMVAAGMGLVLGALAQVGDLAESVLKREAGVKDSGKLLPGHGGILDRFDALFFTIPAAYALYGLWEFAT